MRLELDKSQTACKQDIFDKWWHSIMWILTLVFRVMDNLQSAKNLLLRLQWWVKLSSDVSTWPTRKHNELHSGAIKEKQQMTEGLFAQPHREEKISALRGVGKVEELAADMGLIQNLSTVLLHTQRQTLMYFLWLNFIQWYTKKSHIQSHRNKVWKISDLVIYCKREVRFK